MRIKFNYAFYAQMKIDNVVWVDGGAAGGERSEHGNTVCYEDILLYVTFILFTHE